MSDKIKIENNKINWICLKDSCPNNCCGVEFEMRKKNDVLCSVFGMHDNQVPLTEKEKDIIIKEKSSKYIKKEKDGRFYIKLASNGNCPFLENGLCSIQQMKPTLCKSYPFYIDVFNGLNADLNCLGFGAGWTKTDELNEMLHNLVKIYKHHSDTIEMLITKSE